MATQVPMFHYRVIFNINDDIMTFSSIENMLKTFLDFTVYSSAKVQIVDALGQYNPAFSLHKQVMATELVDGSFDNETQVLFDIYDDGN